MKREPEESRKNDLFGASQDRQRTHDVAELESYGRTRLETIFPKVLKPLALPVDVKPQRFSLFLCISNPDPEAIGLATLKRACTMQVRTRMLGPTAYPVEQAVTQKNETRLADQDAREMRSTRLVWPPLLRKLDRIDPSYKN